MNIWTVLAVNAASDNDLIQDCVEYIMGEQISTGSCIYKSIGQTTTPVLYREQLFVVLQVGA